MFARLLAALALFALTLPTTASAGWLADFYWGQIIGLNIHLQGRDLNGTALNGELLEGRKLAFVSLDGAVDRKGVPLDVVDVIGSRLVGQNADGRFLNPKKMVGSVLMGRLDDGGTVRLRLEHTARHPERFHRDVWYYDVSYETDTGWDPLCGVDEDGETVGAIAMRGRWDLSEGTATGGSRIDDRGTFTFACDGYVLAHCVVAGYKPWRRATSCLGDDCQTISLEGHHQACTRMLRADYCGDGTAHTQDDTEISAYDALGIRADSEDWTPEAEWTPEGANCINVLRDAEQSPACAPALTEADCASPDSVRTGTLIISEHP